MAERLVVQLAAANATDAMRQAIRAYQQPGHLVLVNDVHRGEPGRWRVDLTIY